jgi:S-formylglutathione hydrolase
MKLLKEHACFGGKQQFYEHDSSVIGLPMRFAVYLPPQAATQPVPALMFLAGLTCTEETFVIKAGAQRWAAELGLALICPDTSPRGAGVVGETESWDLGVGAGFYLDAKQAPWSQHYRMESYLMAELLPLICRDLNVVAGKLGIFGHSMGGHGALTLALKHPSAFLSVSAFAPICAPSQCPWGEKAFGAYVGEDRPAWAMHDASALMALRPKALFAGHILIDQGLNDSFLDEQLNPHRFEKACTQAGQALTLRRHEGYDHGYFFIKTFIEDHVRHHAQYLFA